MQAAGAPLRLVLVYHVPHAEHASWLDVVADEAIRLAAVCYECARFVVDFPIYATVLETGENKRVFSARTKFPTDVVDPSAKADVFKSQDLELLHFLFSNNK